MAVSTDVLGRGTDTYRHGDFSGCAVVRVNDSEPMVSIVPYIFHHIIVYCHFQKSCHSTNAMHVHHRAELAFSSLGRAAANSRQ